MSTTFIVSIYLLHRRKNAIVAAVKPGFVVETKDAKLVSNIFAIVMVTECLSAVFVVNSDAGA
jgi:hypothetical protein